MVHGYLCMGTNNSLSLQENWHLLISSLSLTGQTFESLASETTPPCLPSFLALPLFLPFLPILPLHSPSTEGLRSLKLNCHSDIARRRQSFKTSIFEQWRGAWAPAYVSMEQHLHGVNYKRGSASGRGSTRGGQRHWRLKQKTTETETRASLATVYACRFPGWSIPGKIWMPTNQIGAVSARAHVSRELRARAHGHLGVYKESRVAYRAIRVRVS